MKTFKFLNDVVPYVPQSSTRFTAKPPVGRTVRTICTAMLLCGGLIATVAPQTQSPAQAQELQATKSSQLAGVTLPNGAMRVKAQDVPTEITQSLRKLIQEGGPIVKQGRTEVLAWAGNGYKKSRVPQMKQQISNSLKKGGWNTRKPPTSRLHRSPLSPSCVRLQRAKPSSATGCPQMTPCYWPGRKCYPRQTCACSKQQIRQ
jgi:hypothetical protein